MKVSEKSKLKISILQLSKDSNGIKSIYADWINGSNIDNVEQYLDEIDNFLMTCRSILNIGVIPSDPRKRLSKRTVKMLNNYLSKISFIQGDVNKNLGVKIKIPQRGYKRNGYKEVEKDNHTPSAQISENMQSTGKPRIRSAFRNYTQKHES